MIEGGMIEWIKQTDNNWRFDYTIFDEYVQTAMGVYGAGAFLLAGSEVIKNEKIV